MKLQVAPGPLSTPPLWWGASDGRGRDSRILLSSTVLQYFQNFSVYLTLELR